MHSHTQSRPRVGPALHGETPTGARPLLKGQDMDAGTKWVAPGKGATVAELRTVYGSGLKGAAVRGGSRTTLALTGRPIQDDDRRCIAVAVKAATGGLWGF